MTGLEEKLKEMLPIESLLYFNEKSNCIEIEETENNPKSSDMLKSVTIKGIDKCFFAFKFDHAKCDFPGRIFNKHIENIRKKCDAIVFCELNGEKLLLIIELKSNQNEGCVEKMKSTQGFIDYLSSILKSFYSIDLNQFRPIYVLFNRKVNKGKPEIVKKKDFKFFHYGFAREKGEIRLRALQ